MKLDKKYFEGKLEEFYDCKFWNKAKILHQIARDGAEAQKMAGKIELKIAYIRAIKENRFLSNPKLGVVKNDEKYIKEVYKYYAAAINSATVKWEVPGE